MRTFLMTIFTGVLISIPVFAQDIDPGTGTKLTTTDRAWFPSWSPDGSKIAYVGESWDGYHVMTADGSENDLVYENKPIEYDGNYYSISSLKKPGWSPDSRELIFTIDIIVEERGTTVETWKTAGGYRIENEIPVLVAVDIETRETRIIREEAENGRYSPDGRLFGYINYDHRALTDPENAEHNLEIAVEDTETGETTYVQAPEGMEPYGFEFGHDGSYVVASVIDNETYHTTVVRIDIESGAFETIASVEGSGCYWPECSSDGRWILYTNLYSNVKKLYAYDTVTGKTTMVFPESDVMSLQGSLSPDFTKLCCALEMYDPHKGALFVFDFEPEKLGLEPELSIVPLYIPPEYGQRLLPADYDPEDYRPETEAPAIYYREYKQEWAEYKGYNSLKELQMYPAWSPDGQWIAFSTDLQFSSVWIMPSGGGDPRPVHIEVMEYDGYYLNSGLLQIIGFTPDSREVLFSTNIIDEKRGTEVTLDIRDSGFGYSISGVIPVIKAVDIYTGEVRIVADESDYACYSNDGRYLAYIDNDIRYFSDKESAPLYNHVILLDTETGTETDLGEHRDPFFFTPDDSSLIGTERITGAGTYRIISIPLDGGEAVPVAEKEFENWPYVSPDGRFVIYEYPQNSAKVFLYDIETGETSCIMRGMDAAVRMVCWSPDRSKIGYVLAGETDTIFVTDIDEYNFAGPIEVEKAEPVSFGLKENYPNPFNPITTIPFTLGAESHVSLTVYDVTGRKVDTLVDSVLPAGLHEAAWDASDFASGVYIYRLKGFGFEKAGKMTLVK